MNEWVATLVQKCRTFGVALDTGVFVLDVIGGIDLSLVSKTKRTAMFTAAHYQWLQRLCGAFDQRWITPGIVTEACNLLESENARQAQRPFRQIAALLRQCQENYTTSDELAADDAFLHFGLADCSLIDLAHRGCLVVTAEAKVTHLLESQKLPVLNIHHVGS